MAINPQQLLHALDKLEKALIEAKLYSTQVPSPEALASQQPFCIDTLSFEQWLQFVLIVRFRYMVEQQQPLPNKLLLLPMAEEVYKDKLTSVKPVIEAISELDALFSASY